VIRQVWRDLQPMLSPRDRAKAGVLAVESLVAGILEAALLVLVVATALAVAGGDAAVSVHLPVAGTVDIRPGVALALAAGAGVTVLLVHAHSALLTAQLSAGVLRVARDRSIAAFAASSWAHQSAAREGSLQETVTSLSMQSAAIVMQLSNLASTSLGLGALLVAAFLVDPGITVVVLVFGCALFAALRPLSRLIQERSRRYVDANSGFAEDVTQWAGLAMDLRIFGVERTEVRRLLDRNRSTSDALSRSRFMGAFAGGLYRDLAILFLVGAIFTLFSFGDLDFASVGAVVLLIVRSLSYAQTAHATIQSMVEQSPNLSSLLARIDVLDAAAAPVGSRPLDAIDAIELVGVGYDYEPGRVGIDDVTLRIERGEVIGVIGPSGGGKSTLVQVLLRLRPPTRGALAVSGVPYEEISPVAWHRLVALVAQEPRLFEGTVAENIAFFRPTIDAGAIEEAAAAAHVLDDIGRLPDGMATRLGPRGGGLSGGQRQRVAIARALVGAPELLVLDEPTSALDVRSEQLLQRTIEDLKGRVTLVIVAHRLTTLASCDRVVAMDAGRVQVVGTLAEALATVAFEPAAPLDDEDGSGAER
jgi:ABC-type multidrug transport system fused ATPase/permease subunit